MLRIRLALGALLLAGAAHAGIDKAGTTAGNFLSVGTGAAILSMGGATLGGGHDLNAAAWNPGALGGLASQQYALSHAALSGTSTQDWLASGGRLGRGATRWAITALYENDGDFDGRDAFGNPTGTFNVSSLALGAQLAHPIGNAATAGLGLRWVNDYLGEVSGHAVTVDAGVLARFGAFGLGAAARNFGSKMNYGGSSFDLPSVIGAGASWSDERRGLRLALDANFPAAYYNDVRFGGEWRWKDRLALRAGYRLELNAAAGEPLGGPTFGVGGGANGLWMDYGFHAGASEAQGQHRLGLTFWPGFLNRGITPVGDALPGDAPRNATAVREPQAAPKPARAPKPERVAVAPAPKAAPAPAAAAPVSTVTLPPADSHPADVAPRGERPAGSDLAPSKGVRVTNMATPVAVVTPAAAPAPKPVKAARAPKPAKPEPAPVAVATPAPAVVDAPAAPLAPAPAAAPAPETRTAASAPRVEVVVKPLPAPAAAPAAPAPAPRPEWIVTKSGESLAEIAKRWDTSAAAIMMENNLVTEKVKGGMKLRLPPPLKK